MAHSTSHFAKHTEMNQSHRVNKYEKGVIKLMYKIPAVKRMLADPNLQKLAACKCWGNGWVQYRICYLIFSF